MGFWRVMERLPLIRHMVVPYEPIPQERPFVESSQRAEQEHITVTIAALDARQSRRLFGVPMARRGIQPVWLRIENRATTRCRVHVVSIDPNYFSPHEAAAANHFSAGRRLLSLGLLGYLVFLPLLLLIPLKVLSALRANRKMDALFREHAFPCAPVLPGKEAEGFVFTRLDIGSKVVHLRLLRVEGPLEFDFSIPVAGIDADYESRELHVPHAPDQVVDCDLVALFQRLESMPRAVTGPFGLKDGDPANLVVIGEFGTVLRAFGARWDETEVITLATCLKTVRSFLRFISQLRGRPA